MASALKQVLRQRNILVISTTTSLFSIVEMFYRPYWTLYLRELGASVESIGLLSILQTSSYLVFQLPGGYLADRIGRKKVIVYFTVANILAPLWYLSARTWEQMIPGILLSTLSSIYMPAFNAMISESIPHQQRGAGYGAYRMITSIPSIFSSLFGGIVMDNLGVTTGVRLFLELTIAVTLVITLVRALTLKETLSSTASLGRMHDEYVSTRTALRQAPKTIYFMLLAASISSFAMNLVSPYIVLYAVEEGGLTKTQWGLITTTTGIASMMLAIPGGVLSDRVGRKLSILIGKLMPAVSYICLSFSKDFTQFFIAQMTAALGSAFGLGAYGEMGGPAWQALIADLTPSNIRARIMGIMGTFTGLFGLPSPMIGGYIYSSYSPGLDFILSAALGLSGTAIFGILVKEPKVREI